MIWQRVRVALLASIVAMAAALPLVNGGKAQAGSCGSCGSAGSAASSTSAAPGTVISGPATRTITVTEMVPENYTTTRTVTLSSITGDGTLGISIAAGTATDTAGNSALAAGPSATFIVDNTAPTTASVTAPVNGSPSIHEW